MAEQTRGETDSRETAAEGLPENEPWQKNWEQVKDWSKHGFDGPPILTDAEYEEERRKLLIKEADKIVDDDGDDDKLGAHYKSLVAVLAPLKNRRWLGAKLVDAGYAKGEPLPPGFFNEESLAAMLGG